MLNNDILICHRRFEDPLKIPYRTHAHDKWEFLFVVKGNPTCMVEGKRYAIQDNTLIVFKPAQIHRVQAFGSHPYEYFSLMCEESFLPLQIVDLFAECVGILTFKDSKRIQRNFMEINAQFQNTRQDSSLKIMFLMIEELMKSITVEKKDVEPILLSEDLIVGTAITFVGNNVNEITRLDQICDAAGVTKERLYSLFIQNMLISPMKYVRAKRTALAKAASSEVENRAGILKKYGFKSEESFDAEYASFFRSVP